MREGPAPVIRREDYAPAPYRIAAVELALDGGDAGRQQRLAARQGLFGAGVDGDGPADDYERDAFGILVRLFKSRHIAHGRGIEHGDVGHQADAQQPAILEAQAYGRE